ncbi:hypothetical protein KQH27_01010 [bacterium]|nr:hypothetical protein [bacterium]
MVLRWKQFWNDKAYYKLPIAIMLYVIVISIPLLFNFGTEIHTPYSFFYFFLNYPVINVFDIDSIELKLFGMQSLRTSNLTFAFLSIAFWVSVSVVIGPATLIITKTRSYNKANSADTKNRAAD